MGPERSPLLYGAGLEPLVLYWDQKWSNSPGGFLWTMFFSLLQPRDFYSDHVFHFNPLWFLFRQRFFQNSGQPRQPEMANFSTQNFVWIEYPTCAQSGTIWHHRILMIDTSTTTCLQNRNKNNISHLEISFPNRIEFLWLAQVRSTIKLDVNGTKRSPFPVHDIRLSPRFFVTVRAGKQSCYTNLSQHNSPAPRPQNGAENQDENNFNPRPNL